VRAVALAVLLTLGAFGLLLLVVLPAGGAPLLAKPLHEELGPPLLGAGALAWLVAWRRGHEPAAAWVLVLGLVLLGREINFEGADAAFALAALLLAAWAWAARRRLLPSARALPARSLLLAVPLIYALSNLCDLRPVRSATGGISRIALEEPLETIGHTLFLLAGLCAARAAWRASVPAASR
jgi:hypothetical protein